MNRGTATELTLIRHAPALTGGRLCGRTDVDADLSDPEAVRVARALAGEPVRLVASAALRCRQTATALWPTAQAILDPALWEQDFGDWEGCLLADLPELGPLSPEGLAQHRPPGGESFADLTWRVRGALSPIIAAGDTTIVAHAGTIRAALSLALGQIPAGLAFEIAPLSVTRIACLPDGAGWIVRSVNGRAA